MDVPVCRLPVLGILSGDLATCLVEGACRAKLDTRSSFSGSSLHSSSLRSEGSLGRDSTASLTETIDSVDNGDDETGITSKQPTGACLPGNTCDNHAHVFDVNVFGNDQLKACYQALAILLVN